MGRSFDNNIMAAKETQKGGSSSRPVASKNIPQVFRQNHHARARRSGSDSNTNGIGSRGSINGSNNHMRQPTSQKQRSFSNDARLMLHESKRLEQRFAQKQQAIHSLDSSILVPPHKQGSAGDPSTLGQGLFSNHNNFNDVAEFEIYDRKFKQQASTANQSSTKLDNYRKGHV